MARSPTPGDRPSSAGFGILLDIDGVLYVGDQPIEGAHQAFRELRGLTPGLRLMTNTTSRSRRAVREHLLRLGFEVDLEELLTPAAMAERYCRERGFRAVTVLVSEGLREDLATLETVALGASVDAVILGDLGDRFTPHLLNAVFRVLMDGAELVALQHNRYWRRADGLALDVGAYAAALEYATGNEAVTVGKPARAYFDAAMADLGLERGVMVGDDVEADVGGAMAAGLAGVLVRTGKYRQDALAVRVTPTAIVDSVKDVPKLLARIMQGGLGSHGGLGSQGGRGSQGGQDSQGGLGSPGRLGSPAAPTDVKDRSRDVWTRAHTPGGASRGYSPWTDGLMDSSQ